MYPAAPSLLAFVPEPLLAGVIGGVCFLFVAIILSLVTACVMNNRRGQRRRKKRDGKSSDEDCRVIVMILNMKFFLNKDTTIKTLLIFLHAFEVIWGCNFQIHGLCT